MDEDDSIRAAEADDRPERDAIRPVVVVPRRPGPLRPLGPDARAGDDLDTLIDEVFGPSTSEGPGVFDVVLVVAGAGLIAWSFLGGGAGPWFAIGVGLVVLGIALPARSLLRAAGARRAARRDSRLLGSGIPLDLSDASVGALAGSYEALVHAAQLPGVTTGAASVEAAHAAVLEAASLLGGRPPLTDEERAYVERRTRAIRDLASQLLKVSRAWQRSRLADGADVTAEALERAAAVVKAREALEAGAGVGAVDELERIRARLRGDPRP
ncbi:MAG: hypothetical protein WCK58_01835 [Chloroflexota bacterium]